jgi:cytochrome P450
LRKVFGPHFTPRRIERLREQAAELIGQRLDQAAADSPVDFASAVAMRLPASVAA